MIYKVKSFSYVKHHTKTTVLLLALFLNLGGCDDHVYIVPHPHRVLEDGFHKISVKYIQHNPYKNFLSNREELKGLAVCPVTLTFIEMDNASILEILWHQFSFPDNVGEPCEVPYTVVGTLLVDLC